MIRWVCVLTIGWALLAERMDAQKINDTAHHAQKFVRVEPGVSIEVLDWGGRGRPLIIIPGGWVTAHSFDRFAPKLVPDYRVFVVTRRGSGASSNPDSGYDAYRLGDDVLAVMDSLQIVRPVLVGSSLGGLELSSIGSRFPQRVSGLIYLDATAGYSFYDREHGDFSLDLADMKSKVDSLLLLGARPLTEPGQGVVQDLR